MCWDQANILILRQMSLNSFGIVSEKMQKNGVRYICDGSMSKYR